MTLKPPAPRRTDQLPEICRPPRGRPSTGWRGSGGGSVATYSRRVSISRARTVPSSGSWRRRIERSVCVPKRTDLRPIAEVDLADGVQLPASSLDVLPLDGDGEGRRLVMRVGAVDLNLMIDSRTTALALANALTA